jgi:hypothetical protein
VEHVTNNEAAQLVKFQVFVTDHDFQLITV